MKKLYIVQQNREFNQIITTGKYQKDRNLVIYQQKNNYTHNRYGVSVGTKIGNAVIRNKMKRKIRNIIDNSENFYSNSADYIIIVRKNCLDIEFAEIEKSYRKLMLNLNREKEGEKNEI